MIAIKLFIAFVLGIGIGGLGMFFYLSIKGRLTNGGTGKV